ncbi:hypothetical protein Tsubulata_046195 [Turnera subulata]|uniref:Protein dehydration-induced 19 C-terminal domain-containing protein n=1 Tax=Turnera subulata TaxID=218843 RepID=A0A9Q0F5P3_9ROSI|nr:hypothetical protein Tsubulata_046195 [Turnera subulata]
MRSIHSKPKMGHGLYLVQGISFFVLLGKHVYGLCFSASSSRLCHSNWTVKGFGIIVSLLFLISCSSFSPGQAFPLLLILTFCLNCLFQVCPVCTKKVGMDIVGHITTQHGSFFKVQRKRRLRKGGSISAFSMLRKELRDGSLQSLLGGSSGLVSSNTEPDPLLSSFIFSPPGLEEPLSAPPPSVEDSLVKGSTKEEFLERKVEQSLLSHKDQEEKTRKCEFVQGLLLSTILDDML